MVGLKNSIIIQRPFILLKWKEVLDTASERADQGLLMN